MTNTSATEHMTTNFVAPAEEVCGDRGQISDCVRELYHGGFCRSADGEGVEEAPRVTITATAPSYATDGSRGYHLETSAGVHGWASLAEDGRSVWVTLNAEPWFLAGKVTDASEFIPAWLEGHARQILSVG